MAVSQLEGALTLVSPVLSPACASHLCGVCDGQRLRGVAPTHWTGSRSGFLSEPPMAGVPYAGQLGAQPFAF